MSFLFVVSMFLIISVSERILRSSHVGGQEVAKRLGGEGGAEQDTGRTATIPLRTLGFQIAF